MHPNVGKIMTVNGPIEPSRLGRTSSHEHLLYDFSCYLKPSEDPEKLQWLEKPVAMEMMGFLKYNAYANRDNCIEDNIEHTIEELGHFVKSGGQSIVDVTVDDFGRNVSALKLASDRTGLNIVAGMGHYVKSSQPAYLADISVEALADEFINEIVNGVGDTGIRPGIIGEIGTGYVLHPDEVKCLKAAAIAQKETGLTIMVHTHPPVHRGQMVLDILEDAGADLSHCVMAHVGVALTHDDLEPGEALAYACGLMRRGAYVGFDLTGNVGGHFSSPEIDWIMPSDRESARAIAALCLRGYGRQLLISQDRGHKYVDKKYGGWGFDHILTVFKDILFRYGVTQYDYDNLTIHNPARMLTIH